MLKPLTLSLSFALALGASSVSMAGLFDHGGGGGGCSTCGLASPQGVMPTAQAPIASAQCETGLRPRQEALPEWPLQRVPQAEVLHLRVGPEEEEGPGPRRRRLRRRRLRDLLGGLSVGAGPISSPQAYGSGQSYGGMYGGSGQAYGSGQYGSGQYGSGQYGATSGTAPAPAPAPAPAGDEAPPAPNAPSAPSAPAEAPGPAGAERPAEQPALLDPVGQLSIRPSLGQGRVPTSPPGRPSFGTGRPGGHETAPASRCGGRFVWSPGRPSSIGRRAIDKPRRLWITLPSQDATGPMIPGRDGGRSRRAAGADPAPISSSRHRLASSPHVPSPVGRPGPSRPLSPLSRLAVAPDHPGARHGSAPGGRARPGARRRDDADRQPPATAPGDRAAPRRARPRRPPGLAQGPAARWALALAAGRRDRGDRLPRRRRRRRGASTSAPASGSPPTRSPGSPGRSTPSTSTTASTTGGGSRSPPTTSTRRPTPWPSSTSAPPRSTRSASSPGAEAPGSSPGTIERRQDQAREEILAAMIRRFDGDRVGLRDDQPPPRARASAPAPTRRPSSTSRPRGTARSRTRPSRRSRTSSSAPSPT